MSTFSAVSKYCFASFTTSVAINIQPFKLNAYREAKQRSFIGIRWSTWISYEYICRILFHGSIDVFCGFLWLADDEQGVSSVEQRLPRQEANWYGQRELGTYDIVGLLTQFFHFRLMLSDCLTICMDSKNEIS